jgi:phenylpropionate dioxygenase-like ring-hydroxylating dioxygenase large terminal subunit
MLKPEDNERICRVGAGTPMGALMRRYWLPALLSEELPEPDGAPVRVRLLGEDLVAYRDGTGAVGLVDAFCPHRRAPMFFGRNEECGLRCVYHGWKFDVSGACVDMPSEPPDSLFKTKVRITAYPTWEGGGMVWAYLGPPELQPAAPDFEVCRVPAGHRIITKVRQENNWLQALEGGVDSVHSGMLHNDDMLDRKQLRNIRCEVEYDVTPYGLGGAAIHPLEDDRIYARTFHFVMPVHQIRGLTYDRYGRPAALPTATAQITVPIDDGATWVYNYVYSTDPAQPLPAEFASAAFRLLGVDDNSRSAGYHLVRNAANDYLIDRGLQKTTSYSGLVGMLVQDIALQEGMGPICDRSKEHLAYSDAVIIGLRRVLFEGIDAVARGDAPRGTDVEVFRAVRGADAIIPRRAPWRDAVRERVTTSF